MWKWKWTKPTLATGCKKSGSSWTQYQVPCGMNHNVEKNTLLWGEKTLFATISFLLNTKTKKCGKLLTYALSIGEVCLTPAPPCTQVVCNHLCCHHVIWKLSTIFIVAIFSYGNHSLYSGSLQSSLLSSCHLEIINSFYCCHLFVWKSLIVLR